MKNNFKSYFGERAGDDTGMRTAIWGPAGWIFLHSIAQNYPWRPSQQHINDYYNFFVLVGNVLPCRYCRESYQDFIKQRGTQLTLKTMRDRKSVVTWLYKIHNRVNKKLDVKDHPTLKEVWDKYESFRSVCHKTPKHIKKKGCTVPLNGIRKRCVISFVTEKEKTKTKTKTRFGKRPRPRPRPRPEPRPEPEPQEDSYTPPPVDFSEQSINNALSILGLTHGDRFNKKIIRRRFLELSLVHHPDKGGDQDVFKEINNAYSLLMQLNGSRFGKRRTPRFRKGRTPRFGKVVKRRTIKLVSIKRSTKSGKKLMATFSTNGRKKVVHFGASGMSDYTKHKDRVRRNKYIFRHNKDLGTGDPTRAGFLSMFVLWNKPSLQASISDYRRRLNVYNRTGKFPKNMNGYTSPGKNSKYQ